MENLTHTQIVSAVALNSGYPIEVVTKIVNEYLSQITGGIVGGKRVVVNGIGYFNKKTVDVAATTERKTPNGIIPAQPAHTENRIRVTFTKKLKTDVKNS